MTPSTRSLSTQCFTAPKTSFSYVQNSAFGMSATASPDLGVRHHLGHDDVDAALGEALEQVHRDVRVVDVVRVPGHADAHADAAALGIGLGQTQRLARELVGDPRRRRRGVRRGWRRGSARAARRAAGPSFQHAATKSRRPRRMSIVGREDRRREAEHARHVRQAEELRARELASLHGHHARDEDVVDLAVELRHVPEEDLHRQAELVLAELGAALHGGLRGGSRDDDTRRRGRRRTTATSDSSDSRGAPAGCRPTCSRRALPSTTRFAGDGSLIPTAAAARPRRRRTAMQQDSTAWPLRPLVAPRAILTSSHPLRRTHPLTWTIRSIAPSTPKKRAASSPCTRRARTSRA